MSDELKKLDPAESRWQPVAVVNLGKEEPPDPQRPIATVCEIVGAAVFFSVMWLGSPAAIAAAVVALFAVAFYVCLRRWNSRANC